MPHSSFIPAEVHVTNATDAMAKLKKRTAPLKVLFYALWLAPSRDCAAAYAPPHSSGLQVPARRRSANVLQAFLGNSRAAGSLRFCSVAASRLSTLQRASLSADFLHVLHCAQVCVMSADFWGLKTAGGTATAYHLLAAMLAKSHALEVPDLTACLFTVCSPHCCTLAAACMWSHPCALTSLQNER